MKRVWKPLDIGGLRLYQVSVEFHDHPQWNEKKIVLAKSPSDAAEIVEKDWKGDANWIEQPCLRGAALNVLMPEDWWIDGVPSFEEWSKAPSSTL